MKKYAGINKITTMLCYLYFSISIFCMAQTPQKQIANSSVTDEKNSSSYIQTNTAHNSGNNENESLLKKECIIYQYKRVNSVGLKHLESAISEGIEFISVEFCLPYPVANSITLTKQGIKNYDNLVRQESLAQKIKVLAKLPLPFSIGFRGYQIDSEIASEIACIPNIHNIFFDKCTFLSFPAKFNFQPNYSSIILSRSEIKGNLTDIFKSFEDVDSLFLWRMSFNKNDFSVLFSSNLKVTQLQLYGGTVEESSFDDIKFLNNLHYIQLSHLNISQDDIYAIAALPNLVSLQLIECGNRNFDITLFSTKKTVKRVHIVKNGIVHDFYRDAKTPESKSDSGRNLPENQTETKTEATRTSLNE